MNFNLFEYKQTFEIQIHMLTTTTNVFCRCMKKDFKKYSEFHFIHINVRKLYVSETNFSLWSK